jgi:hypothetical protein
MKLRLGRRAWGVIGAAVAIPLVVASIAYACTALATLSLNTPQATPGQTVQGTGRAFSNAHGSAPAAEPVVIRFASRDGQVLWTGRPDASGNIAFQFTVPNNARPGSYAIIATQTNADGQPVAGTPARASLTVTGPAATSAQSGPAAPQQRATGAPAAVPAPQAVPGPAGSSAPAQAVAGQAGIAGGTQIIPGTAPGIQGPPTGTANAPGVTAAPTAVPAPFGAPATQERRTLLGTPSEGVAVLPLALVAAGVVLTLMASGLVVARRREEKALAWTRR